MKYHRIAAFGRHAGTSLGAAKFGPPSLGHHRITAFGRHAGASLGAAQFGPPSLGRYE